MIHHTKFKAQIVHFNYRINICLHYNSQTIEDKYMDTEYMVKLIINEVAMKFRKKINIESCSARGFYYRHVIRKCNNVAWGFYEIQGIVDLSLCGYRNRL